MTPVLRTGAAALSAALIVIAAKPAAAETEAEFFAGKTIRVIIGFAAGGGFQAYGLALARGMAKYIPGKPVMIVQNMPGAGTAKLAAYIYGVAPQDGTVIGLLHQGIVAGQVLDTQPGGFDVTKFNWIGRVGTRLSVGVTWHTSGVRSLADARAKDVVFGATAPDSDSSLVPNALNQIAGTRFKLVQGYAGSAEQYIAMERGETQGLSNAGWLDFAGTGVHSDWRRDNKISILYQTSIKRHPDLPEVPTLPELASKPDDKRIMELLASTEFMGRSFVSGPGLAPTRVATLRKAFSQMMADPDFIADAKAKQLDVDFLPGEELQKLVVSVGEFPPNLVAKARAMVLR